MSDGHFSDLNYEDPVFHEFNSAFLHTIRFTSWLCVMLRIPMVIGNHYGYRKPEKVIEYQIPYFPDYKSRFFCSLACPATYISKRLICQNCAYIIFGRKMAPSFIRPTTERCKPTAPPNKLYSRRHRPQCPPVQPKLPQP